MTADHTEQADTIRDFITGRVRPYAARELALADLDALVAAAVACSARLRELGGPDLPWQDTMDKARDAS